MNADEINEHLSRSNYVGFFDLIGLMLADGVYNPDSSVLSHNSFCFDNSIYNYSYGLTYGNPGKELPTTIKRTFRVDDDIYYTVTKRLYTTRRESHNAYDYLVPNKIMNPDIIKVFNILFRGLTVKWNPYNTYRSFLNVNDMLDDVSCYTVKHGAFNNEGGLVFQCSPNIKNTNLISQVLASPFWSYISKYKLSTKSPFDI